MFVYFLFLALIGGSVVSAQAAKSSGNQELCRVAAWGLRIAAIIWILPVSCVRFIPSGVEGVTSSFGVYDTKNQRPPGITLKWPHERIREVSVTPARWVRNADSANRNEDAGSIFVEGVQLKTDAACQFQVNRNHAGTILANNIDVAGFVQSACSQALREAGVAKAPDGSSIMDKEGKPVDLTLAEALGGKRDLLAKNATYAFQRSLREQLLSANPPLPADTIVGSLVTIGETLPPDAVQTAISKRQARKEELAESVLLVQIEQNKGRSQSEAIRSFVAGLQGTEPNKLGSISTEVGLRALSLLNMREAIRAGGIKWGIMNGAPAAGVSVRAD